MNEISTVKGSISCDFDGIKNYLQEKLNEYKGMVFTEDQKKIAKETVADLRKQKKAFQDRIKEVKTEYMMPYDAFNVKAMEIVALYDEPVDFINEQIAAFEQKRIAEKKKQIEDIYNDLLADMSELIPLQKIYNAKWENATFTAKNIKEEMMTWKQNVKNSLKEIQAMNSEFEAEAVKIYLDSFDFSAAVHYITEMNNHKAMIMERVKQEEEQRIRGDERRRYEEEMARLEEVADAKQEVIAMLTPDLDGEAETYTYEISLTDDAKEKLEMYMDSVGIEWDCMVKF